MSIFVSIRRCPNISNKTLEIYFSNLLHDLKLITRSKGHVTLFGSSSRYVTTLPSLVNLDVDSADNFNLSRDLTKPFFLFQMVMCFCESNPSPKVATLLSLVTSGIAIVRMYIFWSVRYSVYRCGIRIFLGQGWIHQNEGISW